MSRITWNSQQKRQIAIRAYALREFASSDIAAVRQAMEELLPLNVHRNLSAMAEVNSWIQPVWHELHEEETHSGAHQPPAIKPQTLPGAAAHLLEDPMAGVSTDSLAKELITRLLKESLTNDDYLKRYIEDTVHAAMEARLPEILKPREWFEPKPEPAVEHVVKPAKHKVCVIGLMNGQRHMLEAEYPDIAWFFLEGNEGNRIKKQAESMDMTIKTQWAKGQMPSMAGVKNFQHASGMDKIRVLVYDKFKLIPSK